MTAPPLGRGFAPRTLRRSALLTIPLTAALVVTSCGDLGSDAEPEATETAPDTAGAGLDTSLFLEGALAAESTIEDCTLSGGAEATCNSIIVAGYPVDEEVGPFCPDTITDSADDGGLWLDGENLYDVDGAFIEGLAEIYGDSNWQMYDEDGNVLVTETAEEFEVAARPDVDPELENHCVEGRLEWLENGEPIETAVFIPTEPVAAEVVSSAQALLGVTLKGSASTPPRRWTRS